MAGDNEIAELGDAVAKFNLGPTISISLTTSPPRKEGDLNEQDIVDLAASDGDDTDDSDDEGGVALTSENGPSATTSGAQQESIDISYKDCFFYESKTPVEVTFNEPNNAFCFGLTFINCTFPGPLPLCIHNSIVRNVVFIDCHFELARFSNCIMEDMKVINCTYHNSWWFNRVFTTEFITFGNPEDGTQLFDGQRHGMADKLPEKLQTSDYKDSLFSSQRLPSEKTAEEIAEGIAEEAWK